MVFEAFRTGRLAEQEASPPAEFVVLLGSARTFLRVIAHLQPGVVHGGTPPTFLLTAGLGDPTAVDEGAGPVDVPGSGGAAVATASCRRTAEDVDTFLVTVDHGTPSGPWRVQVRNNEPEALEFVGFVSQEEDETLQPWAEFAPLHVRAQETGTTHGVEVRDMGTAPLSLEDPIGSLLGGEGSPCVITARPHEVAPHGKDAIALSCAPVAGGRHGWSRNFVHTFRTNDHNLAHSRLGFEVVGPSFPTMCLPPEGCSARCKEFVPRLPPDEFACETCFHDAGFHGLPSDPDPFPR